MVRVVFCFAPQVSAHGDVAPHKARARVAVSRPDLITISQQNPNFFRLKDTSLISQQNPNFFRLKDTSLISQQNPNFFRLHGLSHIFISKLHTPKLFQTHGLSHIFTTEPKLFQTSRTSTHFISKLHIPNFFRFKDTSLISHQNCKVPYGPKLFQTSRTMIQFSERPNFSKTHVIFRRNSKKFMDTQFSSRIPKVQGPVRLTFWDGTQPRCTLAPAPRYQTSGPQVPDLRPTSGPQVPDLRRVRGRERKSRAPDRCTSIKTGA